MKQKLYLVSNDRIYKDKYYYTVHNDLNTIVNCFVGYFETYLICRFSKKKNFFLINKKIKIVNFFSIKFITRLIKSENSSKFLFISLTPFNFFIFLILKFILNQKNIFFYLRSNGFLEYKKILGYLGFFIYSFMFFIIKSKVQFIFTSRDLINDKKLNNIIIPSELDYAWLRNRKKANLKNVNLLYVGRIKIEKGIFSLIDLLKKSNISLDIVGFNQIPQNIFSNKIIAHLQTNNKKKLIQFYDKCNIFILPSYTESSPKVIWESLSRLRPVIIFSEIKQLAKNKKGVYVCQRNTMSLIKTINFILKNYSLIQKQILQNIFPLNKDFQYNFRKLIQ